MTRHLQSQRYHYVDLLRGMAAIVVLISHYRWFYASSVGDWQNGIGQILPFYSALWPIYEYAHLAVPMF